MTTLKQLKNQIKWQRRIYWIKRVLGTMVILYIFAALIFFSFECQAGVFDVQIYKSISTDSENIVQDGTGAKIRVFIDNVYIYAQKEDTSVRFVGQGGTDIQIFSFGIGTRFRIKPNFYVSFDAGWFEPDFKNMGDPNIYPLSVFSEGLHRYLQKFLMPDGTQPVWDYYTLEYQGAIGCTINLDYSYAISERWNAGLLIGYRYLNFNEVIKGKPFVDTVGWWQIKQPRSFSAGLIALTITYEF